MTLYWDSSSLIAALLVGHSPKGVTRSHTLSEVFSTLTGRGIETPAGRQRIHPDDAAALLADLPKLRFVELNAEETLKAIEEAGGRGVRGGLVHDWLHVQAAQKSKVHGILTENTLHFQALTTIPLQTFSMHLNR